MENSSTVTFSLHISIIIGGGGGGGPSPSYGPELTTFIIISFRDKRSRLLAENSNKMSSLIVL